MALKYYFPTSLKHLKREFIACMLFIGFIIAIMASPANAMKPPEEYGENQCQLIAKDYQNEFGGSLIWIQPIDDWGNPILGKYNAHIINKVYSKEDKVFYYVDYGNKMKTVADFKIGTLNGYPARSYELGIERPEFGMIWHY